MNISNSAYIDLKKLGILKRSNVLKHFNETRDSKKIKVLKDKKLGFFFLNKSLENKKIINSSWKEIIEYKNKIFSNTKVETCVLLISKCRMFFSFLSKL